MPASRLSGITYDVGDMSMRSSARPNLLPVYLLIGLFLFVLVGGLGVIIGFQVHYSGRALPGVHVQGADVSGMAPEEIFKVAQTKSTFFRSPQLTLHVAERVVN